MGARNNDDGGANCGSAYIFPRTGTNTWGAGIKIVAPDPADLDQFGTSVAISGNYAIVGAPYNDDNGNNSGSAYIFYKGPGTWDSVQKIVAPDSAAGDRFGQSVGISGDYAIVGAPYKNGGGVELVPLATDSESGSAYIFYRTWVNTWDEGTRVLDSGAEADDRFGTSVGISGDYAIMGAFSGSAYIFRKKTEALWGYGTDIVAPDGAAGGWFGNSVAISGDYAIVGASFKNNGDKVNAGSAYIFRKA